MNPDKHIKWQEEFYNGPKVWIVIHPDGSVTNYYESKEAAELEVAWHKAQGRRGWSIATCLVHTFKLAKERWEGEL